MQISTRGKLLKEPLLFSTGQKEIVAREAEQNFSIARSSTLILPCTKQCKNLSSAPWSAWRNSLKLPALQQCGKRLPVPHTSLKEALGPPEDDSISIFCHACFLSHYLATS